MNNNNLQQWWENTYRLHQSKHIFDPNELQFFSTLDQNVFATGKSDISELSSLQQQRIDDGVGVSSDEYDTILANLTTFTNPYDGDMTEEGAISSHTLILMLISYGLVVFGGVIGNATLVLTLCSASSIRLRNPLLLAVCVADLFVTGISAPVTLLNLAMTRKTKSLPLPVCKVIHYFQVMPVAASTISFFMLSLDRYATVKHPRLAQLRQRRYLHLSLALVSWCISAIISAPFLFAYKIIAKTVMIKSVVASGNSNLKSSIDVSSHSQLQTPNVSISCTPDLGANSTFIVFIIFHTFAVYIIPGLGVLLNHFGVRQKLCALSLTARAAHGELPLPMPILRRQTHMVIVTGIANAQQAAGCGTTDDNTSNDEAGDIQLHNLNPSTAMPSGRNIIKTSNPISPRVMREIRAHSQRQRINTNQISCGPATPGIPLPQTSTLRSRRRLANMLIASAVIFIACWAPHVFCIFYTNFGYKQYCSKTLTYFNLLLGYMYSAISPIIYWALNHNTLRQSPCAPIIRLRSMQNFLRTHFRSNTVPPPPSSTNEAALGAFNPKLIKLTPKQYRAQASSHYLY